MTPGPAFPNPPQSVSAPPWSLGQLRVEMEDPFYDPSGRFLATIFFRGPTPFPSYSRMTTLFVEARSDGRVIGQYK